MNRCQMQHNSNRDSLGVHYVNVQGILITEKTEARRQELARDKEKALVLLDYLRKVNLADRERNIYLKMKALMLEVGAWRARIAGESNETKALPPSGLDTSDGFQAPLSPVLI